jgi:ABC-2 type transport system ATP-binding protein
MPEKKYLPALEHLIPWQDQRSCMSTILEVQHLKKYYATQKAVDDISFSIPNGSIFGLLGPNGAGKTTLLRMITGIFYPDSGQILFDGKKYRPEEDLRYIGYMPEERGLYKKMKIGDQTLYLARLKGLTRQEAEEKIRYWFARLDMESWYNKKAQDLSKGMGQKLQFVTTVMHNPKLIILDEPFSGLDPVNANLIKDEIYRSNRYFQHPPHGTGGRNLRSNHPGQPRQKDPGWHREPGQTGL